VTAPRRTALDERIELTLAMDGLKLVRRSNPLSVGSRLERTAEHCWHLAMATLIWAPESPVPVNVDRAVTLATVHDFPELYVGDNSVYSKFERDRPERELAAMTRFARDDLTGSATTIFDLWQEFETAASAEATFVHALDMLLPILHNHSNQARSSWRRDKVAAHQVRARIAVARIGLPWLAERAAERVEEAAAAGTLVREAADG
jgi:putative hydrolase of HD superfamily